MTDMTSIANGMGDAIKAFRSVSVTFDNKATPMARSVLAALLSGAATADKVVATAIAAFGNPKSPKTGKPVDSLSGLRAFTGGDAFRKRIESVLKIHENVKGDTALTAIVTAFVLQSPGTPKSLQGLEITIKEAMKAAAALEIGPDAGDEAESADDKVEGDAPKAGTFDLNAVALFVAGMSDEDFLAASDAVAALRGAIAARMDAFATAQLKLAA